MRAQHGVHGPEIASSERKGPFQAKGLPVPSGKVQGSVWVTYVSAPSLLQRSPDTACASAQVFPALLKCSLGSSQG